jgi:hypothetical protein
MNKQFQRNESKSQIVSMVGSFEQDPAKLSLDELETLCIDGLSCLGCHAGEIKKVDVERKKVREQVRPFLLLFREKLSNQGARDGRPTWQAWVKSHKHVIHVSLATANRICGDKPEPKVKGVTLKDDMILTFYGKQYQIVGLPEPDSFSPRRFPKTKNEVEANYLIHVGLRPVTHPIPVQEEKGPKRRCKLLILAKN